MFDVTGLYCFDDTRKAFFPKRFKLHLVAVILLHRFYRIYCVVTFQLLRKVTLELA